MLRTWTRSVIGAGLAVTLMLALATQIVAAAFGQHPALGEAIVVVGGFKLYAPWNVLTWTVQWAARDVAMAFVHAALIVVALLAAFAIAALVSAIEPASFVIRWRRTGFERWAKLGQCGLLGADGLALGAARRHGLARYEVLRAPRGHALLLGAPVHTDDALLAAFAGWRGALVFIEARDLSSRLPLRDAMRFAPGRADAIAINPLFGIRGGVHAWSDALTQARGFLRTDDGMLVAGFAALALDTLAHAPAPARSLSGMRQALADPGRRLAEFCARWADRGDSDLGPATGELARVARTWRRESEAALRLLRDIDARLRLFADGDHAIATEGHQLRFADLVTADGPSSLVIQMPPGRERVAAPLVSALLAQLVAACAPASDLDHLGRAKQRELLIVIEANALAALVAEPEPASPGQWTAKKTQPPLLDAAICAAHVRGVRLLIQAACANDAGVLIGADEDLTKDVRDVFAAIAAFGPQTEASAATAAAMAGQVRVWRRWKPQAGRVSRWLLPYWERADAWVIAPEALQRADPGDGLLLMAGMKPIRCRTLVTDRATPVFLDAASVPVAPHDWDAPPLPPAALGASAALSAPLPQTDHAETTLHPRIGGSKLRRALARRTAPVLARDEQDGGERLI